MRGSEKINPLNILNLNISKKPLWGEILRVALFCVCIVDTLVYTNYRYMLGSHISVVILRREIKELDY